MCFDEHFAMRKLIGTKLKDYIRSNGFSKVSFCMKTEISRTTLDKILNSEKVNKKPCRAINWNNRFSHQDAKIYCSKLLYLIYYKRQIF